MNELTVRLNTCEVMSINGKKLSVQIDGKTRFSGMDFERIRVLTPPTARQMIESEQAETWQAVCNALREVAPGWFSYGMSEKDAAVAAIKSLAAAKPAAVAEPQPFDLEAAKAGAPLVTRDGRKARFVAHVPEAHARYRVLAMIDGGSAAFAFHENGAYYSNLEYEVDLFMAPKPKRTVWVNIYGNRVAAFFDTEKEAREVFDYAPCAALAVAVPVEVEA